MPHTEKIEREIADIKSCPVESLNKNFANLVISFTQLTKAEQNVIAQQFYDWANETPVTSTVQQLKLTYAKCLLGLDYFLSDKHEFSLKEINEARKLFEELHENDGVGVCLVITAGIYRTLGDFDLALKTSWEAYETLKHSGIFMHLILACIVNMANIYFEMHDYEEALKLFNMAYEESEKSGNIYWLTYSLHGLGKTYLKENKFSEAKNFLEKALELSKKHNSPHDIASSLTELANYYFKSEEFEKAEELHKEAMAIREQHHYTGGAVTNYIRLGEVYMKQSKLDNALKILTQGLEVAEKIKVKPKIYQIHFMLSEIFQRKNEPEKSLEHYKKFHAVHEEVEVEDRERKLKNAKLIFEAEQTKKENIIIKKQKAEIEKKNFELQETIDELTRAKIGKRAKAFTLAIAIILFIIDDYILGSALHLLPSDNYFLSLAVKMIIIFSLSPINGAIEKFLLKKVMLDKKRKKPIATTATAAEQMEMKVA